MVKSLNRKYRKKYEKCIVFFKIQYIYLKFTMLICRLRVNVTLHRPKSPNHCISELLHSQKLRGCNNANQISVPDIHMNPKSFYNLQY